MTPLGLLAFLGDPGQTPASQLFIYLMLFLVPGIAVFGVAAAKEREGGAPWVKYVSLVFLGLGAWVGWPFTSYLFDDFAMTAHPVGGTSLWAYRLAFPGPAVLFLAVLVYGVVSDVVRKRAQEDL